MKYLQNLHTHSTYCDGRDTLEEMVQRAIELNFDSIGFSGHSFMHWAPTRSMSLAGTEQYKKEIGQLKEKYKGFEIIEARWLFDVPMDRIDVVVHPESIVHSLVEFTDGATLAQLSPPDMRVPIQYALTWPRRLSAERAKLDLSALASLTFRAPDENRFPALRLVRDAERAGGTRTAVLSAADEIAVSRFLDGDIRYTDIVKLVADTVERAPEMPCDSVEAVLEADRIARGLAGTWQTRR